MECYLKNYLLCFLVISLANVCCCLVLGEESSNPRLDALEHMLAEEKQLRAKLETKVDSLQNSVNSVDSALKECGCAATQKTDKSAFLATFLSSTGFDCHSPQTIVFDDVRLNSGSAYDRNHGIFTAPEAGIYAFQASLTSEPNTAFHVAIVQNVTSKAIGYLFNDVTNIWKKRSTSTVTHLNAGEEVWMICLYDSHITGNMGHSWKGAGDYHSHFSGFLVSAD